MGDLAALAPKLSKLLPLLSSDQDGEVVATARAIGRTLKGAGLDFHTLSEALLDPRAVFIEPRRPPKPPKTLLEIAVWCGSNRYGCLNAKERKFLSEMTASLAMGRQASEKQEKWLRAIFYRVGGEFVP
jgi:hypothetical protein